MNQTAPPNDYVLSEGKFRRFASAAFAWGWFYYLVVPVIISGYYIDNYFPLYFDVQSLMRSIDWSNYWWISNGIIGSFLIGVLVSKPIPIIFLGRPKRLQVIHPLFFLLILGIQFACYLLIREFLFKGYSALDWNESNSVKSFLSGLNITLAVMAIYNFHIRKRLNYLDWSPVIINSFVLLGLGGRMYAVSAMLATFFYMIYIGRWRLGRTLSYSFAALFLMAVTGLARTGQELSIEKLIYILCGEPVLNWIGGANFIVTNSVGSFESPQKIIASVAGFVPTVIWPGKIEYLKSIGNDFIVENPLGGTNILINLLSNFGSVGSLIALFILGLFTGFLARFSARNEYAIPFFMMYISLLAFMLFRDNFYIFQKCLIINAGLLPFFMAYASFFILKSSKNN